MAAKKPKKRGPKEDRLVLGGKWKEAVKKALRKERPKDGWPDPEKSRQR